MSAPESYKRPTTEEFRELIRWGLKNGLLKRAEPPPLPPPKDISPDIKKAFVKKKAEIGP